MRYRVIISAVAIVGVGWLAGCSNGLPRDEELLTVVRANASAAEREDLAAYLDTYALGDDQREIAKKAMLTQRQFEVYDLKHELPEATVESKTAEEAEVHFISVVRRVHGPSYPTTRTVGTYTMRLVNGAWKITDTTVEKTEYLPDGAEGGATPDGEE